MNPQELESLKNWQQAFKRAIFHRKPQGANETLQILSTPDFSVEKRLKVYQYAYRARLIESLEEDFPSVIAKVGLNKFKEISHDYISNLPSRFQTLGCYSKAFPAFLKEKVSPKTQECAEKDWLKLCLSLRAEPTWPPLVTQEHILHHPETLAINLTPLHDIHRSRYRIKTPLTLLWRHDYTVYEQPILKVHLKLLEILKSQRMLVDFLTDLEHQRVSPLLLQKILSEFVSKGILILFQKENP